MKRNLLSFILFTLVVCACSSDDSEKAITDPYMQIKQVTKIDYSKIGDSIIGGSVYTYEYDELNRLKTYKNAYQFPKSSNFKIHYTLYTLEYDNLSRLKTLTRYFEFMNYTEVINYRYSNDTIYSSLKQLSNTNETVVNDTLLVNSKGLLVYETNGRNSTYNYTYDANNNLTKMVSVDYAIDIICEDGKCEDHRYISGTRTTTFEYDNLKSVYSNQNGPKWLFPWINGVAANNITKEYTNGESNSFTSYTPDKDGYPVSAKIIYSDGKTLKFENCITYRTINK